MCCTMGSYRLPLPPVIASRLPTRRPRPLWLLAGSLFLLLYRWLSYPRTPTSAAITLQRLAQNPQVEDRGNVKARALMNYNNPYGFIVRPEATIARGAGCS